LRGLIEASGESTRDPQTIEDLAAQHYEQLFEAPTLVRPHSYVDIEPSILDNHADPISFATYLEVLKFMQDKTKKHTCEAHRLSPFLLGNIPKN
jgi:hypothetical protein